MCDVSAGFWKPLALMNCFIQESSSAYHFSYLAQSDMMSESRSCHAVTTQASSVKKIETVMLLERAFELCSSYSK